MYKKSKSARWNDTRRIGPEQAIHQESYSASSSTISLLVERKNSGRSEMNQASRFVYILHELVPHLMNTCCFIGLKEILP